MVVAKITQGLGTIDRFVHCATIMPTSPINDQPTALIQKIMEINYSGTINVIKTILPQMQERKAGDLITFGSLRHGY